MHIRHATHYLISKSSRHSPNQHEITFADFSIHGYPKPCTKNAPPPKSQLVKQENTGKPEPSSAFGAIALAQWFALLKKSLARLLAPSAEEQPHAAPNQLHDSRSAHSG